MTARRADLRSRMTSAATRRTEVAPPAAETAVRTKPVRITVDLPPAMYQALTGWTLEVAKAAGLPRLSLNAALRAVIEEMTEDEASVGVITARLRMRED